MENTFDVIVVGGGHAGLEAAIASAKMGAKTHLFTILIQNIALASCNPAVGGLGKGHLVKELDALGGVMGEITDLCGLQFRTLNASKGPAVRGTRAQIDMDMYPIIAKRFALNTPNLTISQELITDLLLRQDAQGGFEVIGVKSNLGKQYEAKCVVLTTGTFLNGLIHIGETKLENGRFGELSARTLSGAFAQIGLEVGRLKTGTCARIDGRSIDFSELERHDGDENPPHFSARTKDFNPTQIPCFVTYTNQKTHEIIRQNFYRAPLFTGQIQGVGPRYCPSIEDKVNRFAHKERHQLFLEPQTRDCVEYYINGLTTSLPVEVQEAMIHSIKGLENAKITRYGYAIEYDYIQPTTQYKADSSVPRGTTRVDSVQNAYVGLKAQTYRYIYAEDGTLLEKQDMGVSSYKMRPTTILYNPSDVANNDQHISENRLPATEDSKVSDLVPLEIE